MKRLQLLIFAAVVAVGAALLWFYVSPSAAIAIVCVALLPFTPLAALRFFASIFLLIAVVALISDATPALIGAGRFQATTTAEHWAELSPGSLQAAKASVESAGGTVLWEAVVALVIGWPTSVLFGALGLVAGYAGRRRHQVKIFVN